MVEPLRGLHHVAAMSLEPFCRQLADLLFELPDYPHKRIVFDATQVRDRLARIVNDDDLRRYIL